MSINRIDLAHIVDTPLREGELKAVVESMQVSLPRYLSEKKIAKIWSEVQEERSKKGFPPNEDFDRYFLNRVEGNIILMSMGKYSLFLATNELFLARRKSGTLSEDLLENYLHTGYSIMGLSVVLTSAEGAILIQKRAGPVTQGSGTYMPPAGGFMPNHYPDMNSLLSPNPFVSAHRQLFSEQGIDAELFYVGLSSDTLVSPNPSLTFYGNTELGISDLEEKWRYAKSNYESEFIRFISGEPEHLLRTIRGEVVDFSGSPMQDAQFLGAGIGALMLYGRAMFGSDWFDQSSREAVKNEKTGIDSVSVNYSR